MISLLLVTGTRADFGLWRPVVEAAARDGMTPRLLVTAMHLDPRFGATVAEVRAAGYAIAAEVPCTAAGDSRAEMARSLAHALDGMAPVIERERPDWLLVLGDRGEQVAAALAATHLEVPIAHLHGGERTRGAVDDLLRDLLSRMARLHFVANDAARVQLVGMGVDPATIEVTGGPGLDAIRLRVRDDDAAIRARYGVREGEYLVVAQHPETVGTVDAASQMRATLDAVARVGMASVAVFPNADAGGRGMAALLVDPPPAMLVHQSIPHEEFLALLEGAAAIVGNSSSAIIEAPLLGIPAVNVGIRQEGRTRGDNVVDVPASADAISEAIERAIRPETRAALSRRSPYGDGHAAERIVARLRAEARA